MDYNAVLLASLIHIHWTVIYPKFEQSGSGCYGLEHWASYNIFLGEQPCVLYF